MAKGLGRQALGSCAVGGEAPKRMEPTSRSKRTRSPSPVALWPRPLRVLEII